ncbi:hypothetical protein EJI01_04740 [Variovorax sp. MHTC-1]|nr:hypothetical protein EJI01_04740 [Variovorax sp. MHTC-1]
MHDTAAAPSGNTAEPASPGRWCCPRRGGWRSDTKCTKPGGEPLRRGEGEAENGAARALRLEHQRAAMLLDHRAA